jgi:hypothetical protein
MKPRTLTFAGHMLTEKRIGDGERYEAGDLRSLHFLVRRTRNGQWFAQLEMFAEGTTVSAGPRTTLLELEALLLERARRNTPSIYQRLTGATAAA